MNNIIKNSLFVVALFTALSVMSQEVINVNDVIRIGLENNYDLKIVRNEQQISDNNNTIGNAGYLPTLGISSGYNVRSNTGDNIPNNGDERTDISTSGTQTLDAAVNLNWTIFEGFKVQTNRKRLKELQSMGELNTRLSIENFISNISSEYYNLVQQTQYLKNLQQSVDLSRERLRIVEARYQIGDFSRLDLQQAKVDFNTDSSQLIQQYEVLHSSRIKLNELMGSHDIDNLLSAADTTISVNRLLQKDVLFDDMMQNNTTLLLSHKSKTLSELELKSLQSQNYPYLKLNGSYGFTHYNYNNGNLDQQRNWGPSAGVTLGFNIFDGFNRKREQKNARIRINNQELQTDRQKLYLQSDFSNMWVAYQNNIQLAKLEEESLENAELNYEIAMERYLLGDLSGILLREAQVSLLNAEQRLVSAKYRTKIYEISLMQISGRIDELVQD